jgi:flavin-dependent dehydrogenase
VLRVGNAAGEAHPLIGEGMTLALQSAWLLSQTLAVTRSQPTVSKSTWQSVVARDYAAHWKQLFQPRLKTAAVFAHLSMQSVAAPVLLHLLQACPSLLTRAARWAGKAEDFAHFEALAASTAPYSRTNALRSNDDGNDPEHIARHIDQGLRTHA